MTNTKTVEKKLKQANLKVTRCRVLVLESFINSDHALSFTNINSALEGKEDKATIYRTLKSFWENGLIHEILDSDKTMRYAMCGETCNLTNHKDSHAHFKCTKCENIYCLETPGIDISIPEGFKTNKYNLIIEGFCENCNLTLA